MKSQLLWRSWDHYRFQWVRFVNKKSLILLPKLLYIKGKHAYHRCMEMKRVKGKKMIKQILENNNLESNVNVVELYENAASEIMMGRDIEGLLSEGFDKDALIEIIEYFHDIG